MSLVLLVLLAAVLLGTALGGSLARLGTLRLHRPVLVVLAAVAQAVGALLVGPVGSWTWPTGLAVSAVLAGAFLLRNAAVPGLPLVGLGLALNALVVGANGAMPVSPEAAVRAGAALGDVYAGRDLRHEVEDAGTRLRLLGDVVPVPLPGLPQVVSPGDVLVAAGLAQLVVSGMHRRPPARRPQAPRSGRLRRAPRERPARSGRDWVRTGARGRG